MIVELLNNDNATCILTSYLVGEVYIHMTQEQAQEALQKANDGLEGVISGLKRDLEETQKVLSDLKVQLYAKFGDSINLEADDS